jgi:hypothetical protein
LPRNLRASFARPPGDPRPQKGYHQNDRSYSYRGTQLPGGTFVEAVFPDDWLVSLD